MARRDASAFIGSKNSKLDSFLKRNLPQSVYERVRVHEACVVISDSVNKLYMFVVLTDDCIYLTENPPKTVRVAAHFGDIFGVELVNDVPEFLSGRDRESAQHIRVIYKTSRHQKKQNKKTSSKGTVLPFVQATRGNVNISSDQKANEKFSNGHLLRTGATLSRRATTSILRTEAQTLAVKQSRSLSCPASDNENLHVDGKGDKPRPLPRPPSSSQSLASFSDFTPDKLLYSEKNSMGLHASLINELDTDADEKMEAQLHLYVVSESSLLFLHLKNSWNNYIIRSTLMQDPQYCRKLGLAVESTGHTQNVCRSDQMAKLFNQLTSELFQDEISLEKMYSLLVELKMAAQKYFVLKRLFWKSSDLFPFLINTLCDYPPNRLQHNRAEDHDKTEDKLIFCTLILDILALMLQETETEPACLSLLISKRGSLINNLLMVLIGENPSEIETVVHSGTRKTNTRLLDMSQDAEMENLKREYFEASVSVLYAIILIANQQGSLSSYSGKFMTVGWVISTLQSFPTIVSFITGIVKQVTSMLSLPTPPLSPGQMVLLYQQCYILISCIKHGSSLATFIRTEYREEFRYFIKPDSVEEKFSPLYPITQPAFRLICQLLTLVEQES
ncbi:uncharacterized protein C12orf56 homolog [Erpetoichthys calabaricus]|uniref:uncharacterized protein C12orf56 homolog n=1 Tax=Erpetoichthys calabaricus TaxID=27687 RepID=UPI00109FB385|nr:uncharacterized protein C12orf56 homolog [Erpetoichthys calabaricus]